MEDPFEKEGVRGVVSFFHKCEEFFLVFLFMGMVVVSFSQVVARYVFNSGWIAALELTVIGFAWFTLLGIGYVMRVSSHLGVDVVIRMASPKIFRVISVFGAWVGVVYGIMLLDGSWLGAKGGAIHYVHTMYTIGITTEDLGWPRWLVYLLMPCGLVLFAWRCFWAGVMIGCGKRKSVIGEHSSERDIAEEMR